MGKYKFEVVASYSNVIEIEADDAERAYNLAIESAPNWVDIGGEMAYTEAVNAYDLNDK